MVHPAWPQGVGPESAALMVGDDSGLHRVLLLLARDERPASAAAGCGPADLDLGGIQPQLDAFGLGVGEHIRQGPKPQARTVRDCASAFGQEPAHLSDRAGNGGTVDTGQQSQDGVREIVPQVNQRDDQPVDEHQPMPGTGPPRLTFPGPAASLVTTPLDHGLPRASQLRDQAGQMLPGDTGEQLMRENVPVDRDHHGLDHPTLARSPPQPQSRTSSLAALTQPGETSRDDPEPRRGALRPLDGSEVLAHPLGQGQWRTCRWPRPSDRSPLGPGPGDHRRRSMWMWSLEKPVMCWIFL